MPISGVLTKKLATAPRLAPLLRSETPTGITLHEHKGRGMPTAEDLMTDRKPGSLRYRLIKSGGSSDWMRPAKKNNETISFKIKVPERLTMP